MKKYLIQGMLALAATLMLTGCHEEDVFSGSTLDQKAKAYEETFVEAFGMPNKNHTWGFGTVGNARTRTVLKEDMWDDNQELINTIQANAPALITPDERTYIAEWFADPAHYGFTQGLNISNFYLQHVTSLPNNRTGRQFNEKGEASERNESANLDELHVGAVATKAGTEHVLDFNSQGTGSYERVYIQDGSALQFGVHSTWGTDDSGPSKDGYYWYFRCEQITVPGRCFGEGEADRTAWYVGICFYARANETYNADGSVQKYRELGYQNVADQRCDAWILKVVPGVGETITPPAESTKPKVTVVDKRYRETIITETTTESYKTKQLLEQGRVLCEDLGSSGLVDIDFNDLVFDAKVWKHTSFQKTTVKITTKEGDEVKSTEEPEPTIQSAVGYENEISVVAAGGTLPLSFAGKGDLNTLLGVDSYLYMVNTVTPDVQLAPGSQSTTAAQADFKLEGASAYSAINEIPIWVEFGKETKKLNQVFGNEEGSTGYIPRCLLVPLGTPWAIERTPINEAYADFTNYVQNMKPCWDYAASGAVYPGSESMGLTASPDEDFEEVKYDIVEPTTTTDTQDGGEYYEYHEIEVDQVVPEMVGTSLKIEGAGSLKQYYDTKRIDDSYAYIRGEEFPKTGHVTLRIYGIGADNDGYLWRLYTGTANNNLGGGDGTQYSYNNAEGRASLAANGYIETTVEAATLNSTGWYLAGCNFTLLGVTIVTEDDLKEDTGTTDNPLSIVEGNTLEGTNLLSNSISLNNDGVKPVVPNQSDAKTYAQSLKAGESALAILLTITNDGWYFQTGLSGTSGNDLIEQQSNNNTSFKNGDTIILTRILSAAEIETLTNNANNQYYWGGGMFGIQGNGVTVSKMVIQ